MQLAEWGLVVDAGAALRTPVPGVAVAPLRVEIGGRLASDGLGVDLEEVYERLEAGDQVRTSTPSPGEYLEAIAQVDAATVVILTMASRLSSSFDAALVAASLVQPGRRAVVIDTRTAAAGYGLVARAAIAALQRGADLGAATRRIASAVDDVVLLGALRDLRQLARSGRVPGIAAAAGGLLRVRPLFELRGGEVRRRGLTRGDQRVVEALVSAAASGRQDDPGHPLWLLVVHAGVAAHAGRLRDALHAALPIARSETVLAGPVFAAHTGAGMLGFALLPLCDDEVGVP